MIKSVVKKVGGVAALLASILAFSGSVEAVSLFGNSLVGSGEAIGFGGRLNAVGFDLPVGSDYALDKITFRLSGYKIDNRTTRALVQIYADSNRMSANPGSATLQSVLFSSPISNTNALSNIEFTPTSTFTFLADTRYWLQLSCTGACDARTGGGFIWVATYNTPTPPDSPIGIADFVGYQQTDNRSRWLGNAQPTQAAFQIEATDLNPTPVPYEFELASGVMFFGGYLLLRRIKKQSK